MPRRPFDRLTLVSGTRLHQSLAKPAMRCYGIKGQGRFENEPHSAVTAFGQFVWGGFRIISVYGFRLIRGRRYPLRRGRSALILVSALTLACLTAFSALAQGRNNTPARRPAPEAAPSGHQTEAVDLNEGKSASELFQAGCAVCHQSAAGLAKGRRDSELAGFLRQHYTSSTQHAAVLAGFLATAGGRGGPASASAPGRLSPNAPIDRPPAPIGRPGQEAARPPEREPAPKRKPPEKPPVAARIAPPPPPAAPAAATEAAAHPGDAPAAAPSAAPPVEEKPAAPEIPL